jgi:integrase
MRVVGVLRNQPREHLWRGNCLVQKGRTLKLLSAYIPEVRITHDIRNSFRRCNHNRHAPKRMHRPQVADIDWERGTVSIKRTLRKGPTGQWEYGETKRAGSRRLIRLQNWVLARLRQLREFQVAHPVVDPEEWPEAVELIFVTEFGRPVNVNSLVYKHFKPILKRAGLPNIGLYDLRHTAATLALTVGVSPKVVSEQLGHTRAAFTLDVYSHVLPYMQDDAAAKVEAALLGKNE